MTILVGTILSPGGTPITGTLWLQLSQDANLVGGLCGQGAVSAIPPYIFNLSNGTISGPGQGAYVVHGADCLTPSGLTYHMTVTGPGGELVLERDVSISGLSANLGTLASVSPALQVTGSLAGDVTGSPSATMVVGIRGVPVAATAPTAGQALVFGGSSWAPGAGGGGGGGGITSINGDSAVSQTLIAGANVTITDNGGGGHTVAAAGGGGGGPVSTQAPALAVDGGYIVSDAAGANLVINNFQSDLTGISSGGTSTKSLSADFVLFGTRSVKNVYGSGTANIFVNGAGYFVPTSVTAITGSIYVRLADGSAVPALTMFLYNSGTNGTAVTVNTAVGGGWYRCVGTVTNPAGAMYLFGVTVSNTQTTYLAGWQVEAGSSASSWVWGVRGSGDVVSGGYVHGLSGGLFGGPVGMGTNAPNAAADINGVMATRVGTKALSNGLNSNIALPAFTYIRITGPSAAYSLGGFTSPVDGQRVILYNTVGFAMTLVNEDLSSTAGNRIKTQTGANVLASMPELVYDSTDSRWIYQAPPPTAVPITSVATGLALTAAHTVVRVDASGAARTITLPTAASIGPGKIYYVKKTDSSANAVIIATSGGNTLDGVTGASAFSIFTQYQSIGIISPDTGADWSIF